MSRPTAKTKPSNLTINLKPDPLDTSNKDGGTIEPPTPSSPMHLEGIDLSSFGGDFPAGLLNLPPLPQSPPVSPRLNREASSKTFLTNFKSKLNSDTEQRAEPPQRRLEKENEEYRPGSSSVSKIYHLRKNPGSTPELSLVGSAENVRKGSDDVSASQPPEAKRQPSPHQNDDTISVKRKEKGFRNPLLRSKSIRRDSNSKKTSEKPSFEQPPKTAPLKSDWQNSSEMLLKPRGQPKRGKSAERAAASESDDNVAQDRQTIREKDRGGFVTGSKNVMHKAKTGGGNFFNKLGKIGRAGSTHEKEISDSEYVPKVINLPLIEQTRITRISKDLGSCRDKTEYWMPSLPWRCIDYLNLNCESEGLYRIPGSGPQVKHWQRKFDTDLDVDLLSEEDLYDPNIISSMLKSWLRDLPNEIFPKPAQTLLAQTLHTENEDYQKLGQPVPQKLRDALSELPPFNYYLLFAITCHLSLLLGNKEKNKMDLNNLSICIGPCLDLERWLFNYLVGDWRHCWQGCFTEKQFLEAEKAHELGLEYDPPGTRGPSQDTSVEKAGQSQVTLVDEKATSTTTSTSASRQGSHQDDFEKLSLPQHSNNILPALQRPSPEPLTSETSQTSLSLPDYSQYVNGSLPSALSTPEKKDMLRPSTSHADEGSLASTPRPSVKTHSRSHSDLPMSPVSPVLAGEKGEERPFKVRGEGA